MPRILREDGGVSAMVGMALVAGLVAMALATYVTAQVPQEWKQKEHEVMNEVKDSFLNMQKEIYSLDSGEALIVPLKMGTLSPSVAVSASTTAELRISSASDLDEIQEAEYDDPVHSYWRAFGTYVREDSPNASYTASDYDNNVLLVSTENNHRIRTYLKFDLSDAAIYDSSNYEFEYDAQIEKAELIMYVQDTDLIAEPNTELQVSPPLVVEVWGVENDNWDERMTWNTQIHDNRRDYKLEVQDIDGEGEFVVWDVTPYVQNTFDKYRKWGKWEQDEWWNLQATLESSKFGTGYDKYNSNTGASTGSSLSGTGVVTSMVFDTGDPFAFWNYVGYSASSGTAPTFEVRFGNTLPIEANWMTASSGTDPMQYARYAQYRINPNGGTVYSVTMEYTGHLSFVLREENGPPSTLTNRAAFATKENSQADVFGFDPVVRLTYSRQERLAYLTNGLVNFGSIKYVARNQYLPERTYAYEGGMVYLAGGTGWYTVPIKEPQDFVVVDYLEGTNNIKVDINRYQIKSGSLMGETAGGSGSTSLRIYKDKIDYGMLPPANPNRAEVKIQISTDQPGIWRDYIEKIASEINFRLGGDYDPYGPYAISDYDTVTLIIRGKNVEDPITQDIYYTERAIWLDVTTGFFPGGRT
ncbi:MAG: DNRLRE domain-containing protein [Candidatus Hadarchaeota archaeon]